MTVPFCNNNLLFSSSFPPGAMWGWGPCSRSHSCADLIVATPGLEPPTFLVPVIYLIPWATGCPPSILTQVVNRQAEIYGGGVRANSCLGLLLCSAELKLTSHHHLIPSTRLSSSPHTFHPALIITSYLPPGSHHHLIPSTRLSSSPHTFHPALIITSYLPPGSHHHLIPSTRLSSSPHTFHPALIITSYLPPGSHHLIPSTRPDKWVLFFLTCLIIYLSLQLCTDQN